uniref:NADP-dependent oxidoreductase domain-containing protein n=1 Tax=Romanomermis culicivorax TaxID=13658 RepID=A0A915LAJ4_ROMCU
MDRQYHEGKVKALGVSNYMIKHLEEMDEYAKIKPVVNQCEFRPHNTCPDLLNYCKKHDIHFQAYSSLGSAHSSAALFKEPLVVEMCKKYKCEAAQLLLAWAINQNAYIGIYLNQ